MTSIGVHDGSFHADDALSVYFLKQLREFRDARVVRTRDLQRLDQCTVVVDVGKCFDSRLLRFDHHQPDFEECFPGRNIRLSSAGLVYRFFGKRILKDSVNKEFLDMFWRKVYEDFVEAIDAGDNGIAVADGELRFIDNTTLSGRIGRLNPAEEGKQDSAFERAVALAGCEFEEFVAYKVQRWLPAMVDFQKEFENRFAHRQDGRLVVLTKYLPWKSLLLDSETVSGCVGQVLYVVYPGFRDYRVQCVPKYGESFVNRKPLPAKMGGLDGDELSSVAGVPGCVFCHRGLFLAGHSTFEGALLIANMAIDAQTE